jgi:hypothetical protein
MGRYKEAPFGYQCPYQHRCPHLDGISATWASLLIRDAHDDSYRNGHLARNAEAEIASLTADLERAEKEIVDLRARLKTEHASRFKPNRPPPSNSNPARKRGAPKGHPPWSRRKPDHLDGTIHAPAPSVCPHCHTTGLTATGQQHEQIQEDIVLQPRPRVIRYTHDLAFCPTCRRDVYQTAEGELRNCQIGPTTKATAVFLRHTLKLSLRDVRRVFRDLFAMPFVPASAMAFTHTVAKAAEPHHETLRNKIHSADIVHGDETGWRLDGKSAYLWYAGTPDFSFFHIDRSRAGDVAASIFGTQFQGALVADDYAGYNAIHPAHRQSCLAHLIRKARDIAQLITLLPPSKSNSISIAFCDNLRRFFSQACDLGRQRDIGEISFRAAQAHIPKLYDQLRALCTNPIPHPEAESFRLRLLDPKRDYLRLFTFLDINRMPPTNNHAEQTLRQPVIFRKIIFGSRSPQGAHALSVNLSILHTAQCQHLDPIPILHSLILNGPKHPLSQIFRNTS